MARYTIHYGYMLRHSADFQTFENALKFYVEKFKEGDARLLGNSAEDADENGHGYSDGLTDDEREEMEEAVRNL